MNIISQIFNRSCACAVIAMMVLTTVLASCGEDRLLPDDPGVGEDLYGTELGFMVSVPTLGSSRAPGGDYDDGRLTDYENYIDIPNKDFHIYFFTTDNKFIQEFTPTLFMEDDSQASSPNAKLYTLRGKLEKRLPSNFKIVLLANWPTYPQLTENSTMADLSADTYCFNGPLNLGKDHIPMFGIKTCTDKMFVDGMLTWCDKMHMLRAVAKVEVIEDEQSLDEITGVNLRRYNAQGVCAPSSIYDEGDYVKNDYGTDYVAHVTLKGNKNDSDEKKAGLAQTGSGSKKWVIYVPEYQNLEKLASGAYDAKSVRSDRCLLEVSMRNKSDNTQSGTYEVSFKYYTKTIANANGAEVGDHFNLQRNYDYRFTVTRGTEFEVVAEVLPYTPVTLNPVFGMTRDPEGRIVDIHGRLIDYKGNLMQENEDGKYYLTTPRFTLAPYIPEIGSLVNDHNEPVDELGRRINYDGWLINDDNEVIDANGETTSVSVATGYLTNPKGIVDNYGNSLVRPEVPSGILYRAPYTGTNKLRSDKWGHLIDNATGSYLVNENGKRVDIYMRPIVILTCNGVTRDYLVRWTSDTDYNFIDSNGNTITVNPSDGYMYTMYGRRIDKNGRTIHTYPDGKTYYVKYYTVSEKNESPISGSLFTQITIGSDTYYITKINKYGELVDDECRRINEQGQLIDSEGNVISAS